MNWSNTAWEAVSPILKSIKEMPFITELQAGTLPLHKFQFYISQDAFYLDYFSRALSLIAARCNDMEHSLAFVRFAEGAIVVEKALHASYFEDFNIHDKGQVEPTCHHYGHYLKSTAALDPIEVAVAAVLPCFWIYKEVGDSIYQNAQLPNNGYQKWIDTYAGDEFGKLVEQAIAISNQIASTCTPAQQLAMTNAFVMASRLEYQFWDSAYRGAKWSTNNDGLL